MRSASGLLSAVFFALLHGQAVATLVFGVACVAFQPVVVDHMLLAFFQQRCPKVGVQGGGFVCLFPAALAPALGPALFQPCDIDLYSDSQYVINGLEKGWAKGWKRRGWKKADGSPALNPDLWAQALEQEARHKITYIWVKGHAGHPENERCDQLAVAQSKAHGGRQGT